MYLILVDFEIGALKRHTSDCRCFTQSLVIICAHASTFIYLFIYLFIDLSQYRYITLTLKWTAYMRTTNRCDWGKKQDMHPY